MPLMRAVQVSAPGADFELVNREVPEPEENEVLIQGGGLRDLPRGCARQRGPLARYQVSGHSRA